MLFSSPVTYTQPLQYASKPVSYLQGPVTSYVQQPTTTYVQPTTTYMQPTTTYAYPPIQLARQTIVPTVQIPIQSTTVQYETREVKEQRPKVTYETQIVQVPKTVEVPQTIKDTRIVTVDKDVFETKWIPIQVFTHRVVFFDAYYLIRKHSTR